MPISFFAPLNTHVTAVLIHAKHCPLQPGPVKHMCECCLFTGVQHSVPLCPSSWSSRYETWATGNDRSDREIDKPHQYQCSYSGESKKTSSSFTFTPTTPTPPQRNGKTGIIKGNYLAQQQDKGDILRSSLHQALPHYSTYISILFLLVH